MLGSVDSNTGSPDMGWDTDQFPMDIRATTAVMQVTQYIPLYLFQQTHPPMLGSCKALITMGLARPISLSICLAELVLVPVSSFAICCELPPRTVIVHMRAA